MKLSITLQTIYYELYVVMSCNCIYNLPLTHPSFHPPLWFQEVPLVLGDLSVPEGQLHPAGNLTDRKKQSQRMFGLLLNKSVSY